MFGIYGRQSAWKRNKTEPAPAQWNQGEFQVEMPSESKRQKGFLDGMEQSCWAADLMDHRQKRGDKQEDCIVTETQIEQLKAFLDLVPGSAIGRWFPLNRRKRRCTKGCPETEWQWRIGEVDARVHRQISNECFPISISFGTGEIYRKQVNYFDMWL